MRLLNWFNSNHNKMAVRHDKKIAFIHIPKTAGVAVVNNFNMDIEGDHKNYRYYKEKYPGYYLFAIVRNPYDRLVSTFEFMKKYDLENPEKSRYQDHYKNGFDDLCTKLEQYDNGEWMNLIFKPQHKFICDKNGKSMMDFLFKFEDNFWERLYRLFGEFVEPKVYNKTEKGPWPEYYNKTTKELVYNYYKRDFEIFGYEE